MEQKAKTRACAPVLAEGLELGALVDGAAAVLVHCQLFHRHLLVIPLCTEHLRVTARSQRFLAVISVNQVEDSVNVRLMKGLRCK